jgi:hypothetical protein
MQMVFFIVVSVIIVVGFALSKGLKSANDISKY